MAKDLPSTSSAPDGMKEQLTHSEERFRLLVESVRDYAIYMLNPSGIIVTWNEGAERIKGYADEEVIGRHFSLFYTPEDLASGKPQRELEVAAHEGRYEEQGWRVRKDGTRFWANVVLTPMLDDDGTLKGYAKVTRDFTERRLLEESEERLNLLVSSVRDYAIFMLDPSGIISTWNEGAQRIKGYSAQEIIGRHFSAFYTQEDLDAGKPTLELEVAQKEGKYEEEGWRVRKDGSVFWANVVLTPLWDKENRLRGFAKVTRDMTQRRQMEQELLRANRDLEAFAYSVSHDLRAPLRGITFSSKLLLEDFGEHLPDEAKELVQDQIASGLKLAKTVEDLLNLARISRFELRHEPVDVSWLAREVSQGLVQQHKATAHIVVHDGLSTIADRRLLSVVFQNLIENAIKFSPSGGEITIGRDRSQSGEPFFVRDQGTGFDMAYSSKIFLPFERLVTDREVEGTGIGLASVHRAVQRMDGTIWAESELGKGSTFYFTVG